MNLNGPFDQARQSFSKFWSARDSRERLMIGTAALVVALSLTYALLVAPAITGRKQLAKNMPVLRQQVAQLQALSKEAAAFAGKPAPPIAMISRESIDASLARRGLKSQSIVVSGDSAKVQLSAVSFKGTLDWLVEMKTTAMLSVMEANIVALPQADTVDATFTLRQLRNE